MTQQYITSPGVQINEVDVSLRVNAPLGVGVLAMGFAGQGPTDEVLQVTSLSEYESVYGKPTTPAERYSYHTVKALFDSPANIYFSRLPYGASGGSIFSEDKYSALVYPVLPDDGSTSYADLSAEGLSSGSENISAYYLTKPYHVELSRKAYEGLINGELDWSDIFGEEDGDVDYTSLSDGKNGMGRAGLIVLNTSKGTINETYEGNYLAISDNRNTDPNSKYTDVTSINSINNSESGDDYITIPESRLDFALSADTSKGGSLSEVMENIPSFNIGIPEFDDILTVGIIKLRKTPFTNSAIALSYAITESYIGSFDPDRELQNPTGGSNQSIFLETVDNQSNNLRFFVNPYLQDVFSLNVTGDSLPKVSLRVLDDQSTTLSPHLSAPVAEYANEAFPLGVFQNTRGADKTIGALPSKIERVLDLVENPDLFELDLLVEGGLGTIFCSTHELSSETYDDRVSWPSLSAMIDQSGDSSLKTTQDNYNTIFGAFEQFCSKARKDCMFIADPIRQIFISGENSIVTKQTYELDGVRIAKTFSKFIYWPLRNQFATANSSYAATYGNWVKVYDGVSNRQTWVPYSGFAASLMANMDNVWDAPAGLTRGINGNINDIAIYPKQKERDQLYKISVNPIMFSPTDGFVTWGQKTLMAKPSAFDRINVRRVFLYLEKATLRTVKYFVFEPNTLFTRNQVVNVLNPLFEGVKNNDGIRDYYLLCNEKNNTDEVLEQNQMKIDIYIKPTKTAEFILVDFIATRQDANFQELI